MTAILELRNLSKQYPTQRALSDLTLDIAKSEFFALLGPSGCGKTTTLRLIAGFEEPTSGEIRLNGASIQHLKPYQRNVSTVFQNYALFPHLTVRQNVEFGLRRQADSALRRHAGSELRRHSRSDIARRVASALELVQLTGKEARLPVQISGGERQRVALARSLVLAPHVLLLDEPLSALDPNLRRQVRGELKNLQRRVGITFLFVTHDQEEALSMADRIGVMNLGVLEQVGTPEDIYLRPRTRFVASFLGAINWIEGIGVRPEAVRLGPVAPAGVRSRVAKVVHSTFLGNHLHIEAVLADGQPVSIETSRLGSPYSPGDPIQLWWQPVDELRLP